MFVGGINAGTWQVTQRHCCLINWSIGCVLDVIMEQKYVDSDRRELRSKCVRHFGSTTIVDPAPHVCIMMVNLNPFILGYMTGKRHLGIQTFGPGVGELYNRFKDYYYV